MFNICCSPIFSTYFHNSEALFYKSLNYKREKEKLSIDRKNISIKVSPCVSASVIKSRASNKVVAKWIYYDRSGLQKYRTYYLVKLSFETTKLDILFVSAKYVPYKDCYITNNARFLQ